MYDCPRRACQTTVLSIATIEISELRRVIGTGINQTILRPLVYILRFEKMNGFALLLLIGFEGGLEALF